MIKITLPDGSVREVPEGSSAMDVAKDISHGLARNVLSASFNGKTVEATDPLPGDGELTLYTWDNPEGKKPFGTAVPTFWHKRFYSFTLMLNLLLALP